MFDYTENGLVARQADIAVAYLDLIDRRVAKMNRKMTLLTLIVSAAIAIKSKDAIISLINMKGE